MENNEFKGTTYIRLQFGTKYRVLHTMEKMNRPLSLQEIAQHAHLSHEKNLESLIQLLEKEASIISTISKGRQEYKLTFKGRIQAYTKPMIIQR